MLRVGCFLKRPRTTNSKTIRVNPPNRLAKCQDSIELLQRQPHDFLRAGVGSMMSVMKEGPKTELRFQGKNCAGYVRRGPFMDENYVRPRNSSSANRGKL